MVALAGWIALPLAVAVSPYLVACHALRTRRAGAVLTATVLAGIALNTAVPVSLHLLSLPLSRTVLSLTHLGLAAALAAGVRLRGLSLRLRPVERPAAVLLLTAALLPVLLFPVTHFTGVDTYKWQDLATAVYAREAIPWLVHPVSLLGFTPRAYPAAQPLMLATLYILVGHHIRFGFYVISLWTAAAGGLTALALGRRLLARAGAAELFAACYVLSPVFMRYSHWATGRGFFLALAPALLLMLIALPRLRAGVGGLLSGALLLLTHKVAWVLLPLSLLSAAAAPLLPGRRRVLFCLPLVTAALLLAAAITPAWGGAGADGALGGLLRYGVVRLGWMLPAAVAGLALGGIGLDATAGRRLLPLGFLGIPLLFDAQMYGALIALPVLTALAVGAVTEGTARLRAPVARAITATLVLLSLAGALAVTVQRNRLAIPPRVRRAALFLQAHDPEGPLMLTAPGRYRGHMQAYLTGCPRFEVSVASPLAVRFQPPPRLQASPADTLRAWSIYGRSLLSAVEPSTDWYGASPRRYALRVDGAGEVPAGARRLYEADGVELFVLEPGS